MGAPKNPAGVVVASPPNLPGGLSRPRSGSKSVRQGGWGAAVLLLEEGGKS